MLFNMDFKQELQKRATKHIKSSQAAVNKDRDIRAPEITTEALFDFRSHLLLSNRILALFGAGLSAPSGISTFRGSSDLFRGYDPPMLSTLQKFHEDPILMWWYISYRRKASAAAQPNAAHYALAQLGNVKPNFLAITQNIDNLSQRAGHKPENLQPIHGSMHDYKCTSSVCPYMHTIDTKDRPIPGLHIPEGLDIADESVPLPPLEIVDLPTCPECHSLLRPDVRWFGEELNTTYLDRIDSFLDAGPLDLMLVIGTCAEVYPAASYVHKARLAGARIAFVDIAPCNVDRAPLPGQDWYFQGDVVDIVPLLLTDALRLDADTP